MKKILLLSAAVLALASCDPIQEDIKNGGNVTAAQIESQSSVTLDKTADGKNGNVVTCTTSAPINAKWIIDGKDYLGNYATKKLKLGEHIINLVGLCADGTVDTVKYTVNCQVITNELERIWIYGQPGSGQQPFTPAAWASNDMRFSDNEGKAFPFLSDEVYWGFKTLIFDVANASAENTIKVMSGWWDNVNVDDQHWVNGPNELQLTEDIAKICAKGNNGKAHDLTLMVTNGSVTVNSIYYEE